MEKQHLNHLNDPTIEQFEQPADSVSPTPTTRKAFVEPMVSVPIEVLEATAFFQTATADTSDTG